MEAFATSRLRFTRLVAGDVADLTELHLDPEVSQFLGGVRSPEKTAAYLEVNLRHWTDHDFGLWVLRTEDGFFAGRAGLRYVVLEGRRELEMAYTLVRPLWGQGLGTEVAQALVALWRSDFVHSSLVGIVMKEHSASKHVLYKAGFKRERDAIFHGEHVDVFRQLRRGA